MTSTTPLAGPAAALDLAHVTKRYGGTVALDDVSLSISPGEVHGLIGVNGSGKSTLIKIITGLETPDSIGGFHVRGAHTDVPVRRPISLGIAVLHQQTGLVDSLTVVESVGVAVGFGANWRPVSWAAERKSCLKLADELGVRIDPDAQVSSLSAAERTLVALMRSMRELAVGGSTPLLILDEPTTAFTSTEVDTLKRVVRHVADRGGSVLFVSHKLGEILDFCDRVTVLRNGVHVATRDTATLTTGDLIADMLGDTILPHESDDVARPTGKPTLRVRDLGSDMLHGYDLEIGPGEIVGVTGLAGSGHDDLPYLVAGTRPPARGTVEIHGDPAPDSYRGRMSRGLALVPGDRLREGLWLEATAAENVNLPVLAGLWRRGRIRRDEEVRRAHAVLGPFGLSPNDPSLAATAFSGGNQQKIVLAKAIQEGCSLLVLHEPTVGVDIGAKAEIYALVAAAARSGTAILLVSNDHEEIATLSHRVDVLASGRVAGRLCRDITEAGIAEHANKRHSPTTPSTGGELQ